MATIVKTEQLEIYNNSESYKVKFCNKMIEVLKTRFLQFENKDEALKQLPQHSRINQEVLSYLTQSRMDKPLLEGLKEMFDDIYAVRKDENKTVINLNLLIYCLSHLNPKIIHLLINSFICILFD